MTDFLWTVQVTTANCYGEYGNPTQIAKFAFLMDAQWFAEMVQHQDPKIIVTVLA